MPEAIVLSRTKKAQEFWCYSSNRAILANVMRCHVSHPESFAVEGGDFLVDHVYSQFPEDAEPNEPDILVMFIYSVRPGGLVRMDTGTHTFTKEDTMQMLAVLKREFPEFVWGPWDLPQHSAGYSQG